MAKLQKELLALQAKYDKVRKACVLRLSHTDFACIEIPLSVVGPMCHVTMPASISLWLKLGLLAGTCGARAVSLRLCRASSRHHAASGRTHRLR